MGKYERMVLVGGDRGIICFGYILVIMDIEVNKMRLGQSWK